MVGLLYSSKVDLKKHLEFVFSQHKKDLSQGYGSVYLPHALERKHPHAAKEWSWQYVLNYACYDWVKRYPLHFNMISRNDLCNILKKSDINR